MSLDPAFFKSPLAHRALHDKSGHRAENSTAAIRAAIDAGYGIEIDVQPSSDGVAMVFHDEYLGRLTGRDGRISDMEAEALCRLELLNGGGTIPTLGEVLELVAGRVPLLIEIKDQDGGMGPAIGPLESAVAEDLWGYDGPVAVMSFNPHSIAKMRDLAPDLARGLTTSGFDPVDWSPLAVETCDILREIPDYDRVGATFISHEAADLGRPRVAELKAGGAAILCWTVRSPQAEAEARKVADNVTFEGYRP